MRDLLVELTGKGAAVVGFDILFAEPDRTSVEEIVKHLPPVQADVLMEKAAGEPTHDQTFSAALKEAPSVLATNLGGSANAAPPPQAGVAIAGDDPPRPGAPFRGATRKL